VRVLIVPNTANREAVAAASEVVAWLGAIGAEPVMVSSDAEASGLPSCGVPSTDLGTPALAVALGGDGTILKAFHALGESETPLLGVKFGRLGFLSGCDPSNLRESVEAALAGEGRIERRATLQAEVWMDGRVAGTYRAMNEVVVSRGASSRVVALDVSIDGHRVTSFRSDGLVVATATGSTAYALSAGGPIVSPAFGGLVLVPVAPHTLQTRPIVTGPNDTVDIVLSDPVRSEGCVAVDGDAAPCRRSLERVSVRRGEHDVLLVKLDGRDFYETLAEEFFGG
jgi:NAD+ kinase